MREVLEANQSGFDRSNILQELSLQSGKFLVVSMHRAENVDIPSRLESLLTLLNCLADRYAMPVVVSTHPRTRQRLDAISQPTHAQVRFLKPFSFHDYVRLQMDSLFTLSDNGTISEEASILSFPAVTMRIAMEQPEAMDSGHIILTGLDNDTVMNSIEFVSARRGIDGPQPIATEYEVANTATRVVKLILGTCKLGQLWDGIVAA